MDNGAEGTSWVGNMFRKFETLCLEVDEVVKEEVVHVENGLQTFSAKVATFCSKIDEKISQFLNQEESGVGDVDSGALNIGIDEDHYKKESADANNSLSSCSMESTEEIQIESAMEQNIDSRTYEKLEVTDEEIHFASNEERLPWEDVLSNDYCYDVAGSDYYVEAEDYISSPMGSSSSDNIFESCETEFSDTEVNPAGALTKSVEFILKNDLTTEQEAEIDLSFDQLNSFNIDEIKQMIEMARRKARSVLKYRQESEAKLEVVGVIQKSKALETNEDSDWVIV